MFVSFFVAVAITRAPFCLYCVLLLCSLYCAFVFSGMICFYVLFLQYLLVNLAHVYLHIFTM